MTVAWTSREAYEELKRSGKEQTIRARVLNFILTRPHGTTRRVIGATLGLELGTVAAAVNKLVNDGAILEHGHHLDPKTKKNVKVLWPKTYPVKSQVRIEDEPLRAFETQSAASRQREEAENAGPVQHELLDMPEFLKGLKE